jgi:hypothetical protein
LWLRDGGGGNWSLGRKLDAPVAGLAMREFHLDVASLIGVRPNFQNAANGILFRFDIREDQHLTDVYGRRHSEHGALRKNDHRYGLFFERLRAWRSAAGDFEDARTMNLDGNFERDGIGAKCGCRLALRSCLRYRRASRARSFDRVFSKWRHRSIRQLGRPPEDVT